MASEQRASERVPARGRLGPTRARSGLAFAALSILLAIVTGALGACRQTVVLDSATGNDGGAGTGGRGGPTLDAAPDGERGGNGSGNGGTRMDASRPEVFPFCFGGQIQSLPITMRSPDVIVSVDRSTSMQSWFGAGTRLQIIQQQVHALVAKYRLVKFGYEEFPAVMGMCSNGQGCCSGDVTLPNYNNLKVIDKVFHACDNGGAGCDQAQRPIAAALSSCDDTFSTLFAPSDTGHRYVLLLTSGDPTCMGPDPTVTPCADALTQVTKLSRHNINTAVFGVGDGASGSACLDQLAQYGGIDSGGPSPLYHLAKTPNDLASALDTVVETIANEACKIDVRSPPADPRQVQLLFDGVPVPSDGVDGWSFDPDTTVTLTVHGSYCDKLILNGNRVDLIAGCPAPHN